MMFLILMQNSILNHIHNINNRTVAAFNIQVVVSILICRFFNLCLMVDVEFGLCLQHVMEVLPLFYHMLQLLSFR